MADPPPVLSPRLVWAFGGSGPSSAARAALEAEDLLSGPLFGDAFPSLLKLESWGAQANLTTNVLAEIGVAWAKASSALSGWAAGRLHVRAQSHTTLKPQTASVQMRNAAPFSARMAEDASLEKALKMAVGMAWRIGASTGMMLELRQQIKVVPEIDRLVRLVLLGASGAANTWKASVKSVERLEMWCACNGVNLQLISGVQLGAFLADTLPRGSSVPGAT